jgi:hypothetical protein
MTPIPEQTLCVRCGHIRSVHADGVNECQAYHEVPDAEIEPWSQRCECPFFVAPFADTSPA